MDQLNELMEPLWKSNIIKKESVLFLEEDGFQANLFYLPDQIIKVESSDYRKVYQEGKDYFLDHGKIVLTEHSSIPKLYSSELYPQHDCPGKVFGCVGKGFLRFSEGSYWHKLQTYVTYRTKEERSSFPVPRTSRYLSRTLQKLNQGDTVRMVLYGDSISEGYNASGFVGSEPYMPSYGELVREFAFEKGKSIWLKNTSLAGKDTQWALENVEERVCQYSPDLVILAFGMNDGTGRRSGAEFRRNLNALRLAIQRKNPSCEFIMVAPILPNPKACLLDQNRTPFWGTQEDYASEIEKLCQDGTDLLDMTSIHKILLKKKNYSDMTGNNINHPNDYLIRWYAQGICSMLGLIP